MSARYTILDVDFYADGFRRIQCYIDKEAEKRLPLCKCAPLFRDGHRCERGRLIERIVARELRKHGITAFPEIITCKRV